MSYPRHLHRRDGVYLVVWSDDEQAQALASGWSLLPLPGWPVPDVYREWTPQTPDLVENAEELIAPKKRGRPRKE